MGLRIGVVGLGRIGAFHTGTLAGLFDDFTNIEVDWRAPIQSFSLSRLDGLGD